MAAPRFCRQPYIDAAESKKKRTDREQNNHIEAPGNPSIALLVGHEIVDICSLPHHQHCEKATSAAMLPSLFGRARTYSRSGLLSATLLKLEQVSPTSHC
jgi:hypothetical protein